MKDKDFENVKIVFERNNPALATDPAAIRSKMAEFDGDIQDILNKKPEGFKEAVSILCEGRNFLARYVGEPEIDLPVFEDEPSEASIPNPLKQKFVAVYSRGDGPVSRALSQVCEMCRDTIRYKFYTGTGALLDDLIFGRICGIVAVHNSKNVSVESHLRHDLKNRPMWDYEAAQAFGLPYCVDFTHPILITEIWRVMQQMQEGKYHPLSTGSFNLAAEIPSLVPYMRVLEKQIMVCVVDDKEVEVEGIVRTLKAWPNVKCEFVCQKTSVMPRFNAHTDVFLLDDGMPVSGSEVAKHIKSSLNPKSLLVSITGGEKPTYASYHFGKKISVCQSRAVAHDFVGFFNHILGIIQP